MKILNPIVILGLAGSLCAPVVLNAQTAPSGPESEPPSPVACQPVTRCPPGSPQQARMPDNRGPRGGGEFQGNGGFHGQQAPMAGPRPPHERQAYGPQGGPRSRQQGFNAPGQGMNMQPMNAQGPDATYAYGEPQQRPPRPGQPPFAQGQPNGPQGPSMHQRQTYGLPMDSSRQGPQKQASTNGQCPTGQQRGPAAQGQNRGPGGPQAPWQGQQPGTPANTQEPDWGYPSQPQG